MPMAVLFLEEMSGVEGEIVLGKDKLCDLEEELSRWLGVERALIQEMFQGREAMGMGMFVYSRGLQPVAHGLHVALWRVLCGPRRVFHKVQCVMNIEAESLDTARL